MGECCVSTNKGPPKPGAAGNGAQINAPEPMPAQERDMSAQLESNVRPTEDSVKRPTEVVQNGESHQQIGGLA